MVISYFENPDSRTSGPDNQTRQYTILGTDDEILARDFLLAQLPPLANGWRLQTPEIRELSTNSVYNGDGGSFSAVATWAKKTKEQETGESEFAFKQSTGTTRVFQAIETVATYGPFAPNAADWKGALNWNAETGEVDGIDLPGVNYSEFQLSTFVPAGNMTQAYIELLLDMANPPRANSQPFTIITDDGVEIDFGVEEGLYIGSPGRKRTEEDWQISFTIRRQKTRLNFDIGGITVTEKRGWHDLSVYYKSTDDASNWFKVPDYVVVSKVFDTFDFAELGITAP